MTNQGKWEEALSLVEEKDGERTTPWGVVGTDSDLPSLGQWGT